MPFTTHTVNDEEFSNTVNKGTTTTLYLVFDRYSLYRRWNLITTARLLLLIGTITLVALTTACGDDDSTSPPENTGSDILRAVSKYQPVLYTPFFWFWIMLIIRALPEKIFLKLKNL